MNIKDVNELAKTQVNRIADEGGILWHKRLSHASLDYLMKMSKFIPNLTNVKFPTFILDCEACILGKQANNSSKNIRNRAPRLLEMVHADLMSLITSL